MLNEILNVVKEKSGEVLKGNTSIPENLKDSFVTETASGIFNSLKGGNAEFSISDVAAKFMKGDSNMLESLVGDTGKHVQEKLNLGADVTGPILKSLMPMVVEALKGKASGGLKDMLSVDKVKGLFS
ncbi:MAG TPA: hypothetical protein PKH65_07645 [Bacteroidia bacterium]|nr:hypothetical protein [Bacteroidia bacterium]HNT80538.1 hypothetical protein [Bacteroidia bacterium]